MNLRMIYDKDLRIWKMNFQIGKRGMDFKDRINFEDSEN